jgi:hypothetical protein
MAVRLEICRDRGGAAAAALPGKHFLLEDVPVPVTLLRVG